MPSGFVDTNILIYAAAGAHDEPAKWARATDFLDGGPYAISGQVLAEFYVNATKKNVSLAEMERWLLLLDMFAFQPIDRAVVADGIVLSRRYRISYWDAALIAAAKRLDERTLFTEDLNHGQTYDGVTVVNPLLEH